MRGRDHDLIIQAAADELYAKRELVKEQVPQSARDLRGHLTAPVHGAENDLHDYAELIQILKNKWAESSSMAIRRVSKCATPW
jgi:hypothetical protein